MFGDINEPSVGENFAPNFAICQDPLTVKNSKLKHLLLNYSSTP